MSNLIDAGDTLVNETFGNSPPPPRMGVPDLNGQEFCGPGKKLGPDDIASAARRLAVDEATIRAVTTVESGAGGFLSDGTGRPRILFEAHAFSTATGGAYDPSHPNISSPLWNRSLYRGGALEYDRLAEAIALDRRAALCSASWGMFQVMGSNHAACGYIDIEGFVTAMVSGEPAHLGAFLLFVRAADLLPVLQRHDWATFARTYNGPGYAAQNYDGKLAQAYAVAQHGAPPAVAGAVLHAGMSGEPVRQLQVALTSAGLGPLVADGVFGRVTTIAVEQYQAAQGLAVDGQAGPAVLRCLGLA